MTDLELVLLFAFLFMVQQWFHQRAAIRELRSIIFAVAEKKARIEIDEENKIVRIVNN